MSVSVGPIERFMAEDHVRLESLLSASEREDGTVDGELYARFRHDLLRHIGMEEKVLLPEARVRRGGLYALCDALAGDEAPAVVERLRPQQLVPLAPYYDGPAHTLHARR